MNSTVSDRIVETFQDSFLNRHSYVTPVLVIAYLIFVKYLGPWYMKNRQPFDLKKVLIAYNAIQVVWCAYLVQGGIPESLYLSYNCSRHDTFKYADRIIFFAQHYFYMKIFDLLDTVFFVLRKKYNQISHLHLYHHAGMVLLSYYVLFKEPEPRLALSVVTNAFVHLIMYSYYLLTAYIQDYKKIIWWKKYITQMQLLQFVANSIVYSQLVLRKNCDVKTHIVLLCVAQNVYLTYLFSKFYYNAYIKKKE